MAHSSTLDTSTTTREESQHNTDELAPLIVNRTKKISFSNAPRPTLASNASRPALASRGSSGWRLHSNLTPASADRGLDSKGRRRRSSSLVYSEPAETIDQISDQAVEPNKNANWVNAKGAWIIHLVLIVCLKVFYDIIPGVTQETSWTLTNISYMLGSYIMFHYVRGVPFDFNAGAYDNLNMWEQIDDGDQYTPAKKFLLSVPVCLFLVSTHYTHYDVTYFLINFMATLVVVIPKLPALHRIRFAIFSAAPDEVS